MMKLFKMIIYIITLVILANNGCYASPNKVLIEKQLAMLSSQKNTVQQLLESIGNDNDLSSLNNKLSLALIQQKDLRINLSLTKAKIKYIAIQIKHINEQMSNPSLTKSYEKLKAKDEKLKALMTLQNQHLTQLNQLKSLYEKYVISCRNKIVLTKTALTKQKKQVKIQTIKDKIRSLQEKNLLLIDHQMESQQDTGLSFEKQGYNTLNNIQISLNGLKVEMLYLAIKLRAKRILPNQGDPLRSLNSAILQFQQYDDKLKANQMVLNDLNDQYQTQLSFWQKQKKWALFAAFKTEKSHFDALELEISQYQKQIAIALKQLSNKQNEILNSRKGLIKDTLNQSHQFMISFIKLPKLIINYFNGIYTRLYTYLHALPMFKLGLLILAYGCFIAFWLSTKIYLNHFLSSGQSATDSRDLYHVLARLFCHNWLALGVLVLSCITFTLASLSFGSYQLVIAILGVWLLFKGLNSITRLALLETLRNVSGLDVRLYQRLRFAFLIGGIVTLGTVISHQLSAHYLVRELFDRLFMLFLFMVSIVLLRGHKIILSLLQSYLKPKRFYTRRALDLSTLLVPIALLINGMIGLLGYVQFAWGMSYYQAVIVAVVILYVVIRGILSDTLEAISEKMIVQLDNGWLWTEAFLKPLHQLLRYLIIVIFMIAVFNLYGWDNNDSITNALWQVWHFSLFSFSKINITTKSLIEFIAMLAILLWLAKWSREFCYRWFYKSVSDPGLRNSLAVFSQYAIVAIGMVFTLSVLGVEIGGISMILGGLAVGMGFGLRDFANNIIGGVMLLIERPVKVGDLISLNDVEGRVVHVGIRSMHIRSWDNYEVVIPNADTFSKPFTNWTHQDSVVRTVLPIKVNRQDNPQKVQQLVLDVLDIIPEVLTDPPPQVFLKHIDETLIEMEVRYYINIEQHSRIQVRSTVLFSIMAQFKAAGIRAPVPSFHIEQEHADTTEH